jgi:hypothetical protein
MFRRIVLLLALSPLCTGCLYYAFPSMSQIPELQVDNPDRTAHAFRVDIDRTVRDATTASVQYTLAEIPFDNNTVPGQLEVAPVTGCYDPWKLFNNAGHERSEYTLAVRLYRRNYLTQEVKSWEKAHELVWLPAKDLAAKEKAIDDLLAPPSAPGQVARGPWWDLRAEKSPGLGLQPGLVNPHMHRKALLFAAGEYTSMVESRFAPDATNPNMQKLRDRMRDKAQWLRGFADQTPTQVVVAR